METKKEYKVLKTIIDNTEKNISIISLDNNKYILKRIKNNDRNLVNMLKNDINISHCLKNSHLCPKIYYYNFNKINSFVVKEYIDAVSLKNKKLNTITEKITVMLKIISAIKIIHSLNIIHCDLKPEHILLENNGNIKIIDFDISIQNNINHFKGHGNVAYASKDQITNSPIDKTTDIYSLGIIFYELIMEERPFNGTKREIQNQKVLNNYKKTKDAKLNSIFFKIFEDGNNKYKTIDEFENDLSSYLQNKELS